MVTKPKIYTAEFVSKEVASLMEELTSDENILYKGQLFLKRKYSKNRLSEWAKDFVGTEISVTIKKIDEIIESRLFTTALKGAVNPAVAIFGLKNNYDWKDKSEMQHSGAADLTIKVIRE